jgi:Na+-transporting methylmalonyl-CoA/oxaloacetate decarboxylase beta subunit
MQKTKILFNIINTIFVILYIYPGSILGFLVYGEFHRQPQITKDFMSISSNHVYAFLALSLIGLISYYKSKKLLIINYLILSSIILEVLHLVIPNRSFEYSDLFGNIVGVLLSILLFNIYNFWRKK